MQSPGGAKPRVVLEDGKGEWREPRARPPPATIDVRRLNNTGHNKRVCGAERERLTVPRYEKSSFALFDGINSPLVCCSLTTREFPTTSPTSGWGKERPSSNLEVAAKEGVCWPSFFSCKYPSFSASPFRFLSGDVGELAAPGLCAKSVEEVAGIL